MKMVELNACEQFTDWINWYCPNPVYLYCNPVLKEPSILELIFRKWSGWIVGEPHP